MLKIFQWSRWCLKFILSWATAILHKPAVNFLSEISDYFSLSLPLFKLLWTKLPLPSPPLAPSSGTLHLHSHCGSGNRGMAPPGKSSLTLPNHCSQHLSYGLLCSPHLQSRPDRNTASREQMRLVYSLIWERHWETGGKPGSWEFYEPPYWKKDWISYT